MQASDRTSYVFVLSSVRKDISVSIKFDFETNDHIAYFFGGCYLCTGCTKSIEMRKLPCMFFIYISFTDSRSVDLKNNHQLNRIISLSMICKFMIFQRTYISTLCMHEHQINVTCCIGLIEMQ